MSARRFLTSREVADELSVPLWKALSLIRSGDLASVNVGGLGRNARYRVEVREVERFIRSRMNGAA